MILIADSGGTKTTWLCIENDTKGSAQHTPYNSLGINPIRDSKEVIAQAIQAGWEGLCQSCRSELEQALQASSIEAVYFYGSGCIPPYTYVIEQVLQDIFQKAEVVVESDMQGAAIALCGHHEGIACILGTGSNSCLFDGKKIVMQTPALGYILGDEGGGASLGKRLVGDVLKKQLPPHIQEAFFQETALSQADIIERVYRQPQANMFLASLSPFLLRHREEESIKKLITEEFSRFLKRNILNYNRPDLPIHFVGGIAGAFSEELARAVGSEHLIMGQILAKPIAGIAEYYTSTQKHVV